MVYPFPQWITMARFHEDVWEDVRPIVRAIVGDVLIFLIVLVALALSYLALRLLALVGYLPSRLEVLETLHYYAYLLVLVLLFFDLLGKIASRVLSSWRRAATADE